jgi:hypothetical protein
MDTKSNAGCRLLVVIAAVLQAGAALASDYDTSDADDAVTLERSLFLCQWRSGHGAPEGEPEPVVCTTAAISTDDAVHETKQWWTYWARFDTQEAMKARIRFNQDFQAFQAVLPKRPELADQLLPPGGALPADDWRVRLVQQLRQRYGRSVVPIR